MGAEQEDLSNGSATKKQKTTDGADFVQNDECKESAWLDKLKAIFGAGENNDDNKVQWDVFQHELHSDPMNEFLDAVNVHKSKAQYLFNNMDVDGDGVFAKELTARLVKLRTKSGSVMTPQATQRPRPGLGVWGPFTLEMSTQWDEDEFKDLESLCSVPPRINTYHDPGHIWEVSSSVWTPEIDSRIRKRRDRHVDLACIQGLMNDKVLKQEIARVLGPDVLLWRSFLFLTGDNTAGAITHSWHYDYFPKLLPNSHGASESQEGADDPGPFLTVWIALSDVPPETALEILEGSWRESPGVTREQIGESIFDEQINVSAELERSRRNMSMRKGQFFMFDEFLLHRTAPNANGINAPKRLALALRLVKSSCLVSTESFPEGTGALLMSGSSSGPNVLVKSIPCSWSCKSQRREDSTKKNLDGSACVIFGSFDTEVAVALALQGAAVVLIGTKSQDLEDVAFEVRRNQQRCFVVCMKSLDAADVNQAEIACLHISKWLACNHVGADVLLSSANNCSAEVAYLTVFTQKLAPKLTVKIPSIQPGSAPALAEDTVRWLAEDVHGQIKHHVPKDGCKDGTSQAALEASSWWPELDGHPRTPIGAESLYDKWSEDLDESMTLWGYTLPSLAAEVIPGFLTSCRQSTPRLLDIGCGSGLMGAALENAGFGSCAITGCDISKQCLEVTRRKKLYTDVASVDLCKLPLPFATGSFDCACCIGVMSYIEDRRSFLKDAMRIVGKGGYVCFSHRDKYLQEGDGVELEILESSRSNRAEVVYRKSGLDVLPTAPEFAEGGYPHVTASIIVIRVLSLDS